LEQEAEKAVPWTISTRKKKNCELLSSPYFNRPGSLKTVAVLVHHTSCREIRFFIQPVQPAMKNTQTGTVRKVRQPLFLSGYPAGDQA
jgi:hypothetical protein